MVPSLFLNVTAWPDAAGAGLGENAELPAEPTMATVTVEPVDVCVAAGVDVVVVAEGVVGVE